MMSKAGSINPQLSSRVVSWSFYSESQSPVDSEYKGLTAPAVVFFEEIM